MTLSFRQLARTSLLNLADSIESGRLAPPFTPLAVGRLLPRAEADEVSQELKRLAESGMQTNHIAYVLRTLADERADARHTDEAVELVWTGPETTGSASRDTGVVVRELFANASHSVLVAGFAIAQGKHVFKSLADRMESLPGLQVRMFLNVSRPYRDETPEAEILRAFAESFRTEQWPGRLLPEVFYDPRSLSINAMERASLHAKCIVIDDEKAFVTSANFTEAAQERNIEAGVLIRDAGFAKTLRAQFETLIANDVLRKMPGLP